MELEFTYPKLNQYRLEKLGAATYLAYKNFTGALTVLPLMKIVYLSDREMLAKTGRTISGDYYVCMDNGPVLSQFYDLLGGKLSNKSPKLHKTWESAFEVTRRSDGKLDKIIPRGAVRLTTLSPFENRIIVEKTEIVSDKFNNLSFGDFRDWIHAACPEWTTPEGSSSGLSIKEILSAMKRHGEIQVDDVDGISEEIEDALIRSAIKQNRYAHVHDGLLLGSA